MIGKTQGKIDDQTSLKEVIERKLNPKNNERLKSYYGIFESKFKDNYEFFISGHFSRHFDRSSLKDKIIILTLKEYYLSCPFLLQSDLVDDILVKAIKSGIDEWLKVLERDDLSENQEIKGFYQINRDSIIGILRRIKEKPQCYLAQMRLAQDGNDVRLSCAKHSPMICPVRFIEEKFKAALIKHIETLDTSKVQDICLTFMEKDLQKKLIRANRAARVRDCILCVFFCGMIVGPVVSCLLYGITNKEMLLISSIPIPLLAILSLCIVSLYELSTKNTVRNELEEVKESLNLNCENNQLKSEQALTNF